VIFLDIDMPRLDGYAACHQIRAQPWGKAIKIVALTGWGMEKDRRQTAAAGFDEHLVKPVDAAILTELLSKLEPGLNAARGASSEAEPGAEASS
jgi:CheY-like chemotaxis protein